MGACGCKEINPIVHVPLPNTLGDFDRFSQANTFKCVQYLDEVRIGDINKPEHARGLAGPYAVEVVSKSGKKNEVVVENVAEETQLVFMLLNKQHKKRKKFKPLGDVRREACLCVANLKLLQNAPLIFVDDVDPEFVSAQLQIPMISRQVIVLCDIFEEINVSHSGLVSVDELHDWTSRINPSIYYSVFLFIITEVVTTQKLHHMNVVEFCAGIDRWCIMTHAQQLRTVFEGLADTTTVGGQMAIDITSVMTRFPVPANGAASAMPVLKALGKLYTQRLAENMSEDDEPHLITWEDYERLTQLNMEVFAQLQLIKDVLCTRTLGHKAWNKRRRMMEKEHLESGGAPMKGALVKTFYLRPARNVQSYYSVVPMNGDEDDDSGSEGSGSDADSVGSSDSDDDRRPSSHASYRSSRSRRSRRDSSDRSPPMSARSSRSRSGRKVPRLPSFSKGNKYKSPAAMSESETAEFEASMRNSYSSGGKRGTRSRGASASRSRGRATSPLMKGGKRGDDRYHSPSSASMDGEEESRRGGSRGHVDRLRIKTPPESPSGPYPQVNNVPLPSGPPPAGQPGMGGPPGPPQPGMYPQPHGLAGFPSAYSMAPPMNQYGHPAMGARAHSFSGMPTMQSVAYAQSFAQRASLPAQQGPPPGQYYY